MFDKLKHLAADSLLGLINAFQADTRPNKVDLGVGVYRDEQGNTPVMRAVKMAEKRLLETQTSKRYLGPHGDLSFVDLLKPLVFGTERCLLDRIVGIQTPGGSGALRLGAELVAAAAPDMNVWLGAPSWPNHIPILESARLSVRIYRFVDLTTQQIVFGRVIEALQSAKSGDVVLLHGCCHNPTGIDFSIDQWQQIAALLAERKLVPFIDLAYQGLGEGLELDALPTRLVLDAVDDALVAYSCDKNFGLYRERVGALYLVSRNAEELRAADSNMALLARANWSMPPDHGAAVVRTILESAALTEIWVDELREMCGRVNANRSLLAAAHPNLAFIGNQRGLFSNLSMSSANASALRSNHGIYVADSGRMNLAGMQHCDVRTIVDALCAERLLSANAAV